MSQPAGRRGYLPEASPGDSVDGAPAVRQDVAPSASSAQAVVTTVLKTARSVGSARYRAARPPPSLAPSPAPPLLLRRRARRDVPAVRATRGRAGRKTPGCAR